MKGSRMGRLWKSAGEREAPRPGGSRFPRREPAALYPGAPSLYTRCCRNGDNLDVSWLRQAGQLPTACPFKIPHPATENPSLPRLIPHHEGPFRPISGVLVGRFRARQPKSRFGQ